MADFYATFSDNASYRAHLAVVEVSQNIEANSSSDDWAIWVEKTAGFGYATGATGNSSAIDGSINATGPAWAPYDFSAYSSLLIAAANATVAHDADGTKTASGTFAAFDDAGLNFGTAAAVWALAQTPIPRGAKRWSGSAWQSGVWKRWNGSSWVVVIPKRWSGSAWVPTF